MRVTITVAPSVPRRRKFFNPLSDNVLEIPAAPGVSRRVAIRHVRCGESVSDCYAAPLRATNDFEAVPSRSMLISHPT
jgi:hypothetical protein